MRLPSYKFICSFIAAIVVPCCGRIALNGSGVEDEIHRYMIPLTVGATSGFLFGHYFDKWRNSMKLLEETNEQLTREAKRCNTADSWHYALFEKSHSVILVIASDTGKIVDANPQASRFYGYPVKILKQMYIHEINTESKKTLSRKLLAANKETRKVYYFKHRLASGEVLSLIHISEPTRQDTRSRMPE